MDRKQTGTPTSEKKEMIRYARVCGGGGWDGGRVFTFSVRY